MMNGTTQGPAASPDEARYVEFQCLPDDARHPDGTLALNRHSHFITRKHDFPGSKVEYPSLLGRHGSVLLQENITKALILQAMLYGAGIPDPQTMEKSPHVGISSVWWEGNPCNMHLLDLGKTVKKSVTEQDMVAWQYNTIGVSDAITMGTEGKSPKEDARRRVYLLERALMAQ